MFVCIAPFVFVKVSVYPVLSSLSIPRHYVLSITFPGLVFGEAQCPPDATSDARAWVAWTQVSIAHHPVPLLSAPCSRQLAVEGTCPLSMVFYV